jgi:hypothetical protein
VARANYHLGKFDTSVALLDPPLRSLKKQLGEEHLTVIGVKDLLAHNYYQLGRFEEAIKLKADVIKLQHIKRLGIEKQSEDSREQLEQWKRELDEQWRLRRTSLKDYVVHHHMLRVYGLLGSITLLLMYLLFFWI